jgi:hypothetical protein
MLSRLIVGARLSLFIGITPVICAFGIGGAIGILGRLCGRPRQHRDHADDRRVLRLPLGAARDRAVGRAGRGASSTR